MELINSWILYVGIVLLIVLIFIKFKSNYKDGRKVANTKYIANTLFYKKIMKRYKLLAICTKCVCVLCIILSLVLLARPASVEVIEPEQYNRDIFLCMDVSYSVSNLNYEIIQSFKSIVKNLKGERIGITLFNSSATVAVPLTNDYNYVLSCLDKLEKGFSNEINNTYDYESSIYISSGTNDGQGSSLIGDGLATCAYNFSNLDEKRSRAIIFSTDNYLSGDPICTVSEAAEICKEKGITVYGLGTERMGDEKEFKSAMELTGGALYKYKSSQSVSEIVNGINKKEKSAIKGRKEILKNDIPKVPFIILTISIFILFILNKKVKV